MSITATRLTQAAGFAAAAAGLIFVGVQINHPPLEAATITTTEVIVRGTAKLVMCALALGGISGMYLRQIRQTGWLGLVGYLLLAAFYLVLIPIEFLGAYVLPSLAGTEPGYVDDVLAASTGDAATGDIGALQAAFLLAGALYVAGGLIFGIALFRARVLARWPAVLLAVGTVSTLALAVLPESFNRPFAVPTGVALIGLGISLSRGHRGPSQEPDSSDLRACLKPAGAQ